MRKGSNVKQEALHRSKTFGFVITHGRSRLTSDVSSIVYLCIFYLFIFSNAGLVTYIMKCKPDRKYDYFNVAIIVFQRADFYTTHK